MGMFPARERQPEVIEPVFERHTGDADAVIAHVCCAANSAHSPSAYVLTSYVSAVNVIERLKALASTRYCRQFGRSFPKSKRNRLEAATVQFLRLRNG